MDAGQLAGKVAAVTAGTRSIGRGIAEGFLAAGASVAVNGRSEAKGKVAVDEMAAGDRAVFVQGDVMVQADAERLIDETVERFGRIDILVNNAGGAAGFGMVHEMTDEAWQDTLNWNLNATFWCTRRALRHMIDQGFGRVINLSSVESTRANAAGISNYITNKSAINGFTRAVAFEYGAQGITCNALIMGPVETDAMRENGPLGAAARGITYQEFLDGYSQGTMIKRMNTVEEASALAVLLASDVGGGITGACMAVDGGTSAL